LVYEHPKSGRRRIVHMARSVGDRKQTEAVVQRMLVLSKQLAEVSEHSLRPAPVDALSEQERRVLRSFSEGKSSADIARELKISPQTLRNHLHHINQKLGTHNRLEAVTHAIRRKHMRGVLGASRFVAMVHDHLPHTPTGDVAASPRMM
jgi:DNA-binding CsgD family transcriptional regulator